MSVDSLYNYNPYAMQMPVDSLYNYNPYAMQMPNAGLNNDFMYNATNTQGSQEQLALQQALLQGGNLQQTQGDTFQREGSSSSLNTGLKLAAIGGVGAGAGTYFFGDKLGLNMVKDGKFSDDILKAYQKNPIEIAKTNALDEFAKQKKYIIENNGFTSENYEAVKKYVSTPFAERGNLPEEITDLVPSNVRQNPEMFKNQLFDAEQAISRINAEEITKNALKQAQQGNLSYQIDNLSNLAKRKALLEGLANDATPAQIEELVKANPKVFGIEKTAVEEIANEAKTIAQQYGTKANAVNEATTLVTNAENSVKNIRTTLNAQVASHWDDTAKAFRADAPEVLKNATKNFKWSNAGKWGAIVAGIGLALGCIFGGDK